MTAATLARPVRRAGTEVAGLEGTGQLIRLVLRRDRVRLPVWVLALVGVTLLSANAVHTAYPNQRAIDAYADALGGSPAAVAMAGPPVALHTLPGVILYETMFTALVGVALMSAFLVARHTRAEEEAGRTELLRSTVAGHNAFGAAAFAVATVASLAVGLGVALAVISASVPVGPGLLFGAEVAALGTVFAAITLAVAQVFSHTRTVLGATLGILGIAFLVRAAGDVRGDWLVWLSPIGWSQATHPLGENRWWPLLVSLAASSALVGVGVLLTDRRDLGAGLVESRPGPARAGALLNGPVGLMLRLQRGSLIGWTVGVLLLAAGSGSLTQEMQDLVRNNDQLAAYFEATGSSLVDSFLASMLLILSLGAGGFAVSAALSLHTEESSGRLEPVLATGVSRTRWMLGSLVPVALGSAVVLAAGGLGLGIAYGAVAGDPGQAARLTGLSLAFVPAVWLTGSVAVLLTGWLPRLARLSWAFLALCFVVGWLGPLLRTPDWLNTLSPFQHTPQVPTEPLAVTPLLVMTAAALLAVGLGVTGFRHRDVA